MLLGGPTWTTTCAKCNLVRPNLKDTTDTWEQAKPWQRLHMDWLYIPTQGEILVIVDAGSGWIEAFPCENRSTKLVVKCLRDVFSRFGIPETLVSDNGKEFIAAELKEWLKLQGCHKMESPLYSPRSNGLAERAVQTLKRALKFFDKSLGCSFNAYLQKVLLTHRNSSTSRGSTPAQLLLGKSPRLPIADFYNTGEKVIYKATSNHDAKEMTYVIRKGRNTIWINDDGRNILASDSQVVPKVEPEQNTTQQQTPTQQPEPSTTTDDANEVRRPKRHAKIVQRYQAGFS